MSFSSYKLLPLDINRSWASSPCTKYELSLSIFILLGCTELLFKSIYIQCTVLDHFLLSALLQSSFLRGSSDGGRHRCHHRCHDERRSTGSFLLLSGKHHLGQPAVSLQWCVFEFGLCSFDLHVFNTGCLLIKQQLQAL